MNDKIELTEDAKERIMRAYSTGCYRPRIPLGTIVSVLLILLSIGFIYLPILKYPFVADDWLVFSTFVNQENFKWPNALMAGYPDPMGFRPMVTGYSLALYNIFGLNPTGFRLSLMSLHFLNSLLVAYIVKRILNEKAICWAVAILYAAAARCHLQPFICPAIGFSDIGAVFFLLSSFILFLKERYVLSAGIFFLGIYTKPSAAILPLILFSYSVLLSPKKLKNLWPYFLPLCVFLFGFLRGCRSLHETQFMSPLGAHLIKNLVFYLSSFFPMLFPLSALRYSYLFFAFFVLLLPSLFKSSKKLLPLEYPQNSAYFWLTWFIIALFVTCLVIMPTEYYLTYALIPFIVLLLLLLNKLCLRFRFRYAQLLFWIAAFVSVASSGLWVRRVDKDGARSTIPIVQGAHFIQDLHDKLLRACSALPQGSVLVFQEANYYLLWSLGQRHQAIRIWYKDNSIDVCDLNSLNISSSAMWITRWGPDEAGIVYLASQRPFFLINWNMGAISVRRISFEELAKMITLYKLNQ